MGIFLTILLILIVLGAIAAFFVLRGGLQSPPVRAATPSRRTTPAARPSRGTPVANQSGRTTPAVTPRPPEPPAHDEPYDEKLVVEEAIIVSETSAPAAAAEPAREPEPARTPVTDPEWPRRIDARTGPLDPEARIRLLTDLGIVRAAWCVPILTAAYDEETDPEIRRAALSSLASCRRPEAAETLRRAAASADERDRAIAATGLEALSGDTARSTPSR